jgi:excisionase family DNA binding protein
MEGRFLFVEEALLRRIINEEVNKALNQVKGEAKKDKKMYSRFEVAEMFQVSVVTIDKMVKHGDLHAFKFGNSVMFDADELQKDIDNFRYHKYKHKEGGA